MIGKTLSSVCMTSRWKRTTKIEEGKGSLCGFPIWQVAQRKFLLSLTSKGIIQICNVFLTIGMKAWAKHGFHKIKEGKETMETKVLLWKYIVGECVEASHPTSLKLKIKGTQLIIELSLEKFIVCSFVLLSTISIMKFKEIRITSC